VKTPGKSVTATVADPDADERTALVAVTV
jgi:hypothetical protein